LPDYEKQEMTMKTAIAVILSGCALALAQPSAADGNSVSLQQAVSSASWSWPR